MAKTQGADSLSTTVQLWWPPPIKVPQGRGAWRDQPIIRSPGPRDGQAQVARSDVISGASRWSQLVRDDRRKSVVSDEVQSLTTDCSAARRAAEGASPGGSMRMMPPDHPRL